VGSTWPSRRSVRLKKPTSDTWIAEHYFNNHSLEHYCNSHKIGHLRSRLQDLELDDDDDLLALHVVAKMAVDADDGELGQLVVGDLFVGLHNIKVNLVNLNYNILYGLLSSIL